MGLSLFPSPLCLSIKTSGSQTSRTGLIRYDSKIGRSDLTPVKYRKRLVQLGIDISDPVPMKYRKSFGSREESTIYGYDSGTGRPDPVPIKYWKLLDPIWNQQIRSSSREIPEIALF
ncbi:hypothetical protein AMTR_s00013p00114150 [Amborella trichopoda]|uniref:Uncharacterized protein n=1 Tax=Amborella trichopoda TaxID=13333 RepID=W1PP91_AMBTC|nr:hypothetical protein AMTR_s00013p00114150 [Amborella trichopoda]